MITCASRPSTGMPLLMIWAGMLAAMTVWQQTQVYLPRMWRCTKNWAGTQSSCSLISSPMRFKAWHCGHTAGSISQWCSMRSSPLGRACRLAWRLTAAGRRAFEDEARCGIGQRVRCRTPDLGGAQRRLYGTAGQAGFFVAVVGGVVAMLMQHAAVIRFGLIVVAVVSSVGVGRQQCAFVRGPVAWIVGERDDACIRRPTLKQGHQHHQQPHPKRHAAPGNGYVVGPRENHAGRIM